ncbi:MAG: lipoyl(octanoyl) transferase LipB [Myxococcota bacterium]
MSTERPVLRVRDLGVLDYEAALALQRELAEARAEDRIDDTLLLVEHPPVFTLGRRRGAQANVLATGDTPVVEVERGGDVTWHGPGQLVGYPILKLGEDERDLHLVLRRLEEALIAVLAACGLSGERKEGHTGVWCRGVKVASLGVAVRRWVTFHGFALNVDPDLGWFRRINPCGLSAGVMGSIASLGGRVPPLDELKALAAREVARAFERHLPLAGDGRAS